MRDLLDRYVRSLKEREDDPERYQDLGALVCWILEQRGYVIVEHAYKHKGVERRVSKGRLQRGIDVLACRKTRRKSYRFVLKQGDIGKAEWTPSVDGSMPHDLWLAAEEPRTREENHGLSPKRFVVAAVHNGDRDDEAIGGTIQNALRRMRRDYHCNTLWWDAHRLVDKILAATPAGDGVSFAQHPDASLFPPLVRPFIRMALDSLHPGRATRGAAFDTRAVDLLLDERLPRHENLSEDQLHRALTELALIAHMIRVECERVAEGTTLPVFDTLERILCRAVHQAGKLPAAPSKRIREDLDVLVEMYIDAARRLLDRLSPVLDLPYGLAVPSPGEGLDYPLRSLRLGGHLATAALALHLRAERATRKTEQAQAARDRAEARSIADQLVIAWQRNPGGFSNPVTDDQIIEIGITWELWLRLGMHAPVARFAGELITRLALRKASNLPLPGLWQRARWPMDPDDLQALVEAHARGRNAAPSSFNDRGSTILPLAVYLAQRLGHAPEPSALQAFLPAKSATANAPPTGTGRMDIWTVHAQCWLPPDEAAVAWYAEDFERRGTCRVFDVTAPADELRRDFEAFNRWSAKSTAERLGLPIVDRIAWKRWRTPPPMALFVELTRALPR